MKIQKPNKIIIGGIAIGMAVIWIGILLGSMRPVGLISAMSVEDAIVLIFCLAMGVSTGVLLVASIFTGRGR